MTLASIVASSLVPFDLTIAIAGVASVALTIFVAFIAFLALAPIVSDTWTERLHAVPAGGSALETEANEAD